RPRRTAHVRGRDRSYTHPGVRRAADGPGRSRRRRRAGALGRTIPGQVEMRCDSRELVPGQGGGGSLAGGTHFLATRGTDELRKVTRSFDFILCTVSSNLPWDEYVAALRPQGKLCFIGIPDKPVAF